MIIQNIEVVRLPYALNRRGVQAQVRYRDETKASAPDTEIFCPIEVIFQNLEQNFNEKLRWACQSDALIFWAILQNCPYKNPFILFLREIHGFKFVDIFQAA